MTAPAHPYYWTGRRLAALVADGKRCCTIARRLKIPAATVSRRVAAAVSAAELPTKFHRVQAVPLFPIGPFTPQSQCGHRRPLPEDSMYVCMVCHCGGGQVFYSESRRERRAREFQLRERPVRC